jgi:serine/threonine protein kinase
MPRPAWKRVEELFHQAVELPPGERAAFLDRACAGDADLRAAVEELLRHDRDDDTARFLPSPVARPAAAARQAERLPHIPGYVLLEELGRGGMGVVYKARQTSLGRLVALKMLLPGPPATPEQLARFRTEAEALARLHHPNIVPIYEVGEHEGQPYFTMEYVPGPSLGHFVASKPQEFSAAARLVEVLARAMQAAHLSGIVHRDLKPANVLLSPAGGPDSPVSLGVYEPRITDFGLAKDLAAGRKVTLSGMTMGTPSYMAPEQARGGGSEVGPAADVFSLGAILYELLTGRPPFDAATPAETVAQLLGEDPLPPSRLRPGLPRDLATICLKCLEKSPRRRFASAGQLADELRRFQAGEPILSRRAGPLEKVYRWCRRRPLVAFLLALSGGLLAALIATVLVYNARLQEALAQVRQQSEERRQQIVRLNVIIGITELDAGDSFTAILRFTEALRLDQGDDARERNHRTRIATALRHSPRLVRLLIPDGEIPFDEAFGASTAAAEVAASPDGRLLVTGSGFAAARVWDRATGRALTPPLRHAGPLLAAAISPDGRELVIAGRNGTVCVWELSRAEEGPVLPPEGAASGTIRQATLSPDGSRRATVAEDGTARVWDAATGEALAPVLRLSRPITRVCFHPDGDHLVGVCEGGTGTTWDLTPDGRSAGDLAALAQVLACGRIDEKQERKMLDRSALRAAWKGLR